MSVHKYVAAIGLLAALVGFIFLFVPMDAKTISGRTVECGSIAIPDKYAGFGADIADAYMGGDGETGGGARCDDALDGQKGWVFTILFGGLIVAVGGFATASRRATTADRAADEKSPQT